MPTTTPPGVDPIGYLEPLNSVQKQALLTYANGRTPTTALNRNFQSLDAAQQGFSPLAAMQYANPFVGSVIDTTMNRVSQTAERQRAAARERAARLGTSNSSAEQLRLGEIDRGEQETAGQIASQLYSQSFNNAQNQFNVERNRNLAAAPQYGAFAGNSQAIQNTATQNQLAAGNTIQQQNQQKLSLIQQLLANKQNYPKEQLAFLANMLKSYPTGSTTTTSTPSNPVQGLLGGGMLGYSLGGQLGNMFTV